MRLIPLVLCSALAVPGIASAVSAALTYSTYLRDHFTPNAIAADPSGNLYLAGNVNAGTAASQSTVLVVKLNPRATGYVYVRYLGGSVNDYANAITVDSAGNAYVAGVTASPDFPVTAGGRLGTAPTTGAERSFVAKLDATGELVFSDLLGGSANSYAQAVAVNAAGQVLVSGTSVASGFPSTPGVYSVTDTAFAPYLLELDPTGTRIVFAATGIGGSAIALDPSGNIYVAGTTGSLAYPTTPGTYQPAFPVFQTCIAPCHGSFQGPNQYVTKLDPTGARLIYSTAVSGTGNTTNQGLAVDSAGNVYLTGFAGEGYPFTVPAPAPPLGPALAALATPALPFLTKLDPNGQKLLFSVPVGGLGVKVDANGVAYVGGILGLFSNYDVAARLPALASLPAGCALPNRTRGSSAYVSAVDPSGSVLHAEFIGGSTLTITGAALSGASLWIAGATSLPDFPFSPNALAASTLSPNPVPGAYLGAIDFSQPVPPAGAPQVGCMVDSANLEPAGPIAPLQLLTILGTGLGPEKAEMAGDNSTTTLGGVSVTFGSEAAPLLYVSSSQINLAVPPLSLNSSDTEVQVTVNGVSSPRFRLPLTSANPGLFVEESFAVARNADGSRNSAVNPAPAGSVVSVFVNGLSAKSPVLYASGGWSVKSSKQSSPFVLQVDLQVPAAPTDLNCALPNTASCIASFRVYDLTSYLDNLQPGAAGGLSFEGMLYIAPVAQALVPPQLLLQ
jgi:uncharacterized protein (TIGR03437 family)